MKKIILLIALSFFVVSCNTYKASDIASKDKKTKHVLVFVNNTSKKHISNQEKMQLINATDFKKTKDIVYHTEKEDAIDYDYGLELIVKEIEIKTKKIAPKEIPRHYNAYNKREYFDLETRVTPVPVASISAKQDKLISHRIYKSCNLVAEINLIDLKKQKLIDKKNIEIKTNFSKVYNVTKEEGYLVDQNENDYYDLNNIGIMRNEAPLKNYKVSTTYNVNYEPTDKELTQETLFKLKNKLIGFTNKI
ncbi:hypothetical protein [Flavobacterium sp. J27]|uniref:hypothetical protein n=1 Tax=Flavobacterium sp. J27 TaxID=2060419 RepID=UPI00102F6313|nr:hypothetical protein [Flavobacterium sp. J27]